MKPWYQENFFKYGFGILLILAIIYLFYQIDVLIKPLLEVVSALFLPVVFSFLLYYLLRPVVLFLEKLRVPKYLAIFLIYCVAAILLIVFFTYLGPILAEQVTALANLSVETFETLKNSPQTISFADYELNFDKEIKEKIFSIIQQATSILSQNLISIFGFITHLAVILAVIPFILFYLLKDDRHIAEGFIKMIPHNFQAEVSKILRNIDSTLSSYINGLVLVSSTLGLLLFIGYLIIGLKYALVLSIIALIFTTIPFLGPFLAIAPALLISISQGPFMMLKVIIVFVIVQQTESNIISPLIIGHRLHIHPLTIILLLIAAGSLYGLIGLLLATPAYAITKVLVANLYKIYRLRFSKKLT
jgi:predicted PurR-regulated permease PerM